MYGPVIFQFLTFPQWQGLKFSSPSTGKRGGGTININIPWALRIAAFPRPAPEPWFLFFMLFSIGAFFNISGKMRNRILLPLMYTCSSCATRPSLYVTVMLDIWKVKIRQGSQWPLTQFCIPVSRACRINSQHSSTKAKGFPSILLSQLELWHKALKHTPKPACYYSSWPRTFPFSPVCKSLLLALLVLFSHIKSVLIKLC